MFHRSFAILIFVVASFVCRAENPFRFARINGCELYLGDANFGDIDQYDSIVYSTLRKYKIKTASPQLCGPVCVANAVVPGETSLELRPAVLRERKQEELDHVVSDALEKLEMKRKRLAAATNYLDLKKLLKSAFLRNYGTEAIVDAWVPHNDIAGLKQEVNGSAATIALIRTTKPGESVTETSGSGHWVILQEVIEHEGSIYAFIRDPGGSHPLGRYWVRLASTEVESFGNAFQLLPAKWAGSTADFYNPKNGTTVLIEYLTAKLP